MKKIFIGHTLIELMLACAMISLLSYFEFSQFTKHFLHEKRLAAAITLLKVADALEEFHLEHHTYRQATLADLGFTSPIANNRYALQITSASSDDYTLAAIPQNSQTNDAECGTLLLSANGTRASTGTEHARYCWQ